MFKSDDWWRVIDTVTGRMCSVHKVSTETGILPALSRSNLVSLVKGSRTPQLYRFVFIVLRWVYVPMRLKSPTIHKGTRLPSEMSLLSATNHVLILVFQSKG